MFMCSLGGPVSRLELANVNGPQRYRAYYTYHARAPEGGTSLHGNLKIMLGFHN